MKVSFEGIGENMATFEAETTGSGKVLPGSVVKIVSNGKVAACTASGDLPLGIAREVRDGFATVQYAGYMKMPCAAALTLGLHHLAMNSSQLAAEVNGGRCALVTDIENGVCGVIL